MSFQAMTWAVEQPCKNAGQKLVLLMLANCTNHHTGQCNPSHSRLSSECCMGVSTLKGHLAALEEDGFITIIRRQNEGVDLPNQYQLNMRPPRQNSWVGGQELAGGRSESDRPPRSESGYKTGSINQEVETNTPCVPHGGKPDKPARAKSVKQVTAQDLETQGIEPAHAEAWLAIRKAKHLPLTLGAWDLTCKAGADCGLMPPQTVKICIERGWAAFRADWYTQQPQRQQPSRQAPERDYSKTDYGPEGLI